MPQEKRNLLPLLREGSQEAAGFLEVCKNLTVEKCPFVNLPDKHKSRLGEGLTAEKMKKAVWVKQEIVAQIEFLEWTEANRLRHCRFVALRDDKDPRGVTKEFFE
jgi:ATP-dependent DNA ligase